MKNQVIVTGLVLIVCIVIVFTACGKEDQANIKTDQAKKIAVVVSTMNNPFFVVLGETAKNRVSELGYDVTLFDSQNNTAKEAEHFENIIAADFDAIVFNPTDADGSISNVLMAKEAGIPTFCMDREINTSDAAVCQVLSDNYSGCVALGQYFVKKLNKTGNYVELLGLVGDNNTWNRSKGFHSVVDNYPNLKMVVQQSADFDRNKAMEVMESILQGYQDINAVFCCNDEMAIGAYQALAAANKADLVLVFGFDGIDDALNSISEKKLVATGKQFPKLVAKTAVDMADKYLNGEKDPDQKIPVAVELVTRENVENYLSAEKQ